MLCYNFIFDQLLLSIINLSNDDIIFIISILFLFFAASINFILIKLFGRKYASFQLLNKCVCLYLKDEYAKINDDMCLIQNRHELFIL